ncbi:PAS domain S-box protein [Rufibacter roseus]|uniref:histidine kinase n=1 Tax=Rufibacter roseus TaxID=1567108 RepID=A0ABW2DMN0_9BACT|nr:PAS domain S-box protein [Rufibacter roseus]
MINLYTALARAIEFKRLLIGMLSGVILLAILLFGISYHLKKENELSQWTLHSQEEIYLIEKTISLAKDYETSARGFIITNQDKYKQPLTEASKQLESVLLQLEGLMADDVQQKQNLDSLSYYLRKKVSFSNLAIQVRREQGSEAAMDLIYNQNKNLGLVYMNKVRTIADAMHTREAQVLEHRKSESEKISQRTNKILSFFTAFFVLLLLYVLWKSWQQEKARRVAVEKIKQQEEHFRALIENNSEAIFLRDKNFNFTYCSPAAERILGFSREEITTPGFKLSLHPGDEEQILQLKNEILHTPSHSIKGKIRVKHEAGHYIWLEGETKNLLHQESVQAIVSNFTDVTDRVLTELAAQEANALQEKTANNLSRIMASSLDVICTIDAEGRFAQVSDASINVWGYKPEEMAGQLFMDFVAEQDKELTAQVAAIIMAGTPVTTFENNYVRPDGSLAPVLWSARWSEEDQVMYCIAKDAREKRELEKAYLEAVDLVKESEAALAEAQRIAKTGSWSLDLATQKLFCSEELYNVFGTDKEHFTGTFDSFLSFVDESEHTRARETTAKAATDGEPFDIEYPITTGKGERRTIQVKGSCQRNDEGQIFRLYGTAQDITEIKESKNAILASEEKYKLLFYQAPLPKWIYDLETLEIIDVNNSAVAHYGYSREEFLSMTPKDLRPAEDAPAVQRTTQGQDTGRGTYRLGLWKHVKKDGTIIFVEVSAHSLMYDQRNCLLVEVNDVTQQVKAEQELKKSNERWETVSKVTFDAIWEWDLKTNELIYGKNYQFLFGHCSENSKENFQTWQNHLHPEDIERVKNSLETFVQSGESTWQEEYRKLNIQGTYAYCHDRGILIRDAKGEPVRMIGALRDVTESKLAAENLLMEKNFSEALLEATPDGIVGFNEKGEIIIFNKKAESLFGYSQDEITGTPLTALLPQNTHAAHYDRRDDFFSNPSAQKLIVSSREMIAVRKDKSEFPVDVRLNFLHSYKGKIVISSVRDITHRKLAEEQLKESEKNLKAILSSSQEGIYLLDLNYKLVLLNEHAHEIILRGYGVDCKSGDHFPSLFDSDLNGKLKEIFEKVITGKNWESDRPIPLDGEIAHYHSLYFPVRDHDGNIIGICCSSKDVTEKKKTEEAILLANAEKEEYQYRFKAVLDYSPQAILIKDLEGNQIFANKAFKAMFGLNQDQDIHSELQKVFENEIAKAEFLAAEKPGKSDTLLAKVWAQKVTLPDGETLDMEIMKFPLYDRQEQLFGIGTICKDISEQIRHQQQLIEARENAENAERLQEQFLANMSHELRTPMNGIIGMVNLLLTSSSLQPDQKVRLQVIRRSSDTLLSLINDILDLSKIKAGMLTIEKVNFDFNESITGTTLMFKERAREKGVRLNVSTDPFIPRVLSGDPHRLNQILNNLLSNAIKFTDKGTIRLEASLVEEHEGQAIVEFIVSDSGIGIDSNRLHLIFDNFAQATSDISSKYGGTGLGLAITKRLIEMQGGEIHVESTIGQGTTFTFQIPYKINTDVDAVVTPYHKSLNTPVKKFYNGKSALIVEDNEINQVVLASSLKQHYMDFVIANNGQEAIDILETGERFDIIFMDLRMPIMDGFQATAYIRQKLYLSTPIVVLTASVLRNERERCLEIGASDYMAKPFAMSDLAHALEKFISFDEQTSKSIAKTPSFVTSYTGTSDSPFDISQLMELEDPDFIRQIFNLFLEKVPPYLQELKQSFGAGNCKDFLEKAHKLKGSLSSVRIDGMFQLLLSMEEKVMQEDSLKSVEDSLNKCLSLYYSLIPEITLEVDKQLIALEAKI